MPGEAKDNMWPLPKFYFSVKLSSLNKPAVFQEISGLETNTPGDDNEAFTFKRPKMERLGNLILKNGVFVKDDSFFKWYDSFKTGSFRRETVSIQLLDEKLNPTITWTLLKAWPSKITIPDQKSDTNEVAIETIELTYEAMTVESC